MKKNKFNAVISSVICSVLAMSNVAGAYAAEPKVTESMSIENELSTTDMLTMTSQEAHEYKMWLYENQEHVEEQTKPTAKKANRRNTVNDFSYSGSCGDNLTYSYDDESKTLTISGTGRMWSFDETGVSLFPWNDYRTEIENVIIGENVTYISRNAFSSFSSLKSVDIPSSVDEISFYSFAFCENLESVSVHARVINQRAFHGCTSLKSVDLSGVEDIAWRAFSNCSALSSITIPSSINVLWQPFYNCPALESVNVSSENEFFVSIDGVLFDKDITTLYYYPSNKADEEYHVPSSVDKIEGYAFAYGQNLINPVIPSNCTLGEGIFQNSYYSNHWIDTDSSYRYHSNNGYYYLIINNVLLNVESDNDTPLTTLDFTNSIHNANDSMMISKVNLQSPSDYKDVTNVISDYWVDIQYNCLSETQWYNSSDLRACSHKC